MAATATPEVIMPLAILPESHLDHGLSQAHLDCIRERYQDRDGFFIDTFELPTELGSVPCGLFGPIMGDAPVPDVEVEMAPRGTRAWPSRLVGRTPRPTRTLTVIAGPAEGASCVLYTAFGGPLTPKEPGDPTCNKQESEDFWATHALAR